MKKSEICITTICCIVAILLFNSCNQPKASNTLQENNSTAPEEVMEKEGIAALESGEYFIKEKEFGEIIELEGENHPVDHIFSVREAEMIAQDSLLFVKNLGNKFMVDVYSLPHLKHIQSFVENGRGPGQFQAPRLVRDGSGENRCYIFEQNNNTLYSVDDEFVMHEQLCEKNSTKRMYADKQLHAWGSKAFIYVESVKQGKAIFRSEINGDTVATAQLRDISFSEKHKNWASYIGDFGVNFKKKRAVYAYKKFKRILIYDFENNISKTIVFDDDRQTKVGNNKDMLAPTNITHYWGMSSNEKYFYVLYSGRTPVDVYNELKKSDGYIYIEQFDWNGNPIRKFKLNHWGYFCVNEQENTIYLLSTTAEHPFYSFALPSPSES
jgi:hypothetical protein